MSDPFYISLWTNVPTCLPKGDREQSPFPIFKHELPGALLAVDFECLLNVGITLRSVRTRCSLHLRVGNQAQSRPGSYPRRKSIEGPILTRYR